MASTPFVRLLVSGTIQNNQTWSIGVSVGTSVVVNSPGMFTFLSSLVTPTTTWWNAASSAGSLASTNTKVLALRAYSYDSGAHKSSAEASVTMSLTGSGAPTLPTQLSIVCSLRSGVSSRHGRGRFYLPLQNVSMLANGQLTNANCDGLAAATKTWLDAIAAATIPGATNNGIVIATGGSNDAITVITVQVDAKVDTQRRRADKIGAGYRAIANL